jgi:hypothetical protein
MERDERVAVSGFADEDPHPVERNPVAGIAPVVGGHRFIHHSRRVSQSGAVRLSREDVVEEQSPNPEPSIRLEEDAPPPKPPGFWARQYDRNITTRQKVFDFVFGVAGPIALLALDPIMFRGGACPGFNANLAAFVYFAVGLGVIALSVWLVAGPRLRWWVAPLAGALLTGGLFALAVGVVMLPFSLLGLIACIGVLGFVPFVTMFVYHRNGLRALEMARALSIGWGRATGLVLAGALLVVIIPGLIQWRTTAVIDRAVGALAADRSAEEVASAIRDLQTLNNVCLGLCSPNISFGLTRQVSTSGANRHLLDSANRQVMGWDEMPRCSSLFDPLVPQSNAE